MSAVVDSPRIGETNGPARKHIKLSDLPISSAKRATIDSLLQKFKKDGSYDRLRKNVLDKFEQSESRQKLVASLKDFSEQEIERDPAAYLTKDRRAAAPLLEGAAARSGIYATLEADLGAYIATFMQEAEATLREFRRKEIGDEAAEEERARHDRLDAECQEAATVRQQEHEKAQAEQRKLREQKELEDKRRREAEHAEMLEKRKADLDRQAMEALLKEGQNSMMARTSHKTHYYPPEKLPGPARRDASAKSFQPPTAPRYHEAQPSSAHSPYAREGPSAPAWSSSRRSSIYHGDRPATAGSPHEMSDHAQARSPSERRSSHRGMSPPAHADWDRRNSTRDSGHYRERSPVRERPRDNVRDVRRGASSHGATPSSDRRVSELFSDEFASKRSARRRESSLHHSGRQRDSSRSPVRRHDRSRSPARRSSLYKDAEASSRPSKRPRSTSPPDIDRSVPDVAGQKRRSTRDGEHDREGPRDERSYSRDRHRDRDRDSRRDRERDRNRDRDRDRDRDLDRSRESRRERERSRPRDHHRRRDRSRSRRRSRSRHRNRSRDRRRDRYDDKTSASTSKRSRDR